MILVIFGVGALVFFLTVYGTVVAGGLRLTREQLEKSPDLEAARAAAVGSTHDHLSTRDIAGAEF